MYVVETELWSEAGRQVLGQWNTIRWLGHDGKILKDLEAVVWISLESKNFAETFKKNQNDTF